MEPRHLQAGDKGKRREGGLQLVLNEPVYCIKQRGARFQADLSDLVDEEENCNLFSGHAGVKRVATALGERVDEEGGKAAPAKKRRTETAIMTPPAWASTWQWVRGVPATVLHFVAGLEPCEVELSCCISPSNGVSAVCVIFLCSKMHLQTWQLLL